jgi:hypothetical protein
MQQDRVRLSTVGSNTASEPVGRSSVSSLKKNISIWFWILEEIRFPKSF